MDQINWRFCGAFLAGKRQAIAAFCDEYLSELEHSVLQTSRITWDVNWLAYLESLKESEREDSNESVREDSNESVQEDSNESVQEDSNESVQEDSNESEQEDSNESEQEDSNNWTPVWYRADHNDSIIEIVHGLPIPTYSLNELLKESNIMGGRQTEYDFPIVPGFHAGSTSFVRWNDQSILNTRYINYSLANEGKNYIFATSEFLIKNRNYASMIDPVTAELIGVQQMNDTDLLGVDGSLLKRPRGDHLRYISYGLEDIRLFVGEQNALKFIATTVDYSPVQGNRMMVGNYDPFNNQMSSCMTIESPDPNSWCEKNWIPLFRPDIDTEPHFIYRWWPYEIGKVDASNQLRIHTSVQLEDPIFKHTRGSTIFHPCSKLYRHTCATMGDFLVGVVHFSQTNASNAREYYHYLVALDRTTLLPVARSPAFYFFQKSIEFAIGFDLLDTSEDDEQTCRFWVSRMDIDPVMVEVEWRTFRFSN